MKSKFSLVFSYLYFVGFKFCSVITYSVTPVTKFKTVSFKLKILRFIWWVYLNRFEIFALRQIACLVLGRNLLLLFSYEHSDVENI